jgi:hypothetical protein
MLSRLGTAVPILLLSASLSWGQQQPAPTRMSFTIGVGYDQGDFGSTEVSRAAYIPVALRYSASPRVEVGVSSALARINTPGGVVLIEGVPTPVGGNSPALRETGMGDTVVRSRFFLLPDRGPGTPSATVTPFFKVKIPTAPADEGLGTGKADYGFGVELDKDFGPAFLFGDAGYTVVGKVPALGLRNRPSASIGIGKQLKDAITASGILDWRRALIAGNPDPVELTGVLSLKMSPNVLVSPNAFVGLTNGTSDFGVGIQMRVKFARF